MREPVVLLDELEAGLGRVEALPGDDAEAERDQRRPQRDPARVVRASPRSRRAGSGSAARRPAAGRAGRKGSTSRTSADPPEQIPGGERRRRRSASRRRSDRCSPICSRTTLRVTSSTRAETPSGPSPSMIAPSPPFQNARPMPERRPHEQEVVELVEVPLVEQEAVERRIGVGQRLRRGRGRRCTCNRRRARPISIISVGSNDTSAGTCSMSSRILLSGADEQRVLPEALDAAADEPVAERDAGDDRAERQHGERNQHHLRRFVRGVGVVAVVVGGVVVIAPWPSCASAARRRRGPVAALAEEGHEHQPPRIERGQAGGERDADEGVGRAERRAKRRTPR